MGRFIKQEGVIMSLKRNELEVFLNSYLNISNFSDYCPNGLQVEGKENIKKIAYAVSATKYSIEKAIEEKADALIVHHGLFWKFHGTKPIIGPFANRLKPLIKNDINLFGYHLPLDAHLESGNASSIAKLLNLQNLKPFGDYNGVATGVSGTFKNKVKVHDLKLMLEKILNHEVILSSEDDSSYMDSIGIITGGANSDWILAKKAGLDAYLTGEISEHNWHEAMEAGIHYFAGGHNATEQFGIQELMKVIQNQFKENKLEHFFIESKNPA